MTAMLNPAPRWSHARGNTVVPSRWQATPTQNDILGHFAFPLGYGLIELSL